MSKIPNRPRIDLDSDNAERLSKIAQKYNLSLTVLVNLLLRSVQAVEVRTSVAPTVESSLPVQPGPGEWKIEL